ncbi:hypothetical protein [Kosakonia cowanii]
MYTNSALAEQMRAEKFLAIALDHALTGVKDEMLKQVDNLQTGATRIAFYASCFTQNYQDVCARQKAEDIRFAENLFGLINKWNVIERMIRIYVDLLLQNLTPERLRRIERTLFRQGSKLVTGSFTNQALASAITTAACYSFGMKVTLNSMLFKVSIISLTLTGWYAYVQKAADASARLKQHDGIYWQALYAEKLEMLYFLIEPVISRNPPLSRILSSDEEIAAAIMRILR